MPASARIERSRRGTRAVAREGGAASPWTIHAAAWATTTALAYVLCAIFDALFPPYGLLALLAPASPWPLAGSPAGFAVGLVTFTLAGLGLGAIYGLAWGFWAGRAS